MNYDAESHRLWELLLKALGEQAWQFRLCCATHRLAALPVTLDPAISLSATMQELLQQSRALVRGLNAHQETVDDHVQAAAWRFAAHAYDLRRGDHLTCADGRPPRLIADELFVTGHAVGHLELRAWDAAQAGQPGRHAHTLTLFDTVWRKLPP